jgi:hypothetical protein
MSAVAGHVDDGKVAVDHARTRRDVPTGLCLRRIAGSSGEPVLPDLDRGHDALLEPLALD